MSIYVIEFVADYLVQYGFSFSKETAYAKVEHLNRLEGYEKYHVTEYSTETFADFCFFD